MARKKSLKKTLIISVSVIVLLILTIVVIVNLAIKMSKAEYGDNMEFMASGETNPLKALVVYQPSLTSATSDAAHAIARGLNDSGLEVILNHPGSHLSADVSGYDVLVLGMPNYGSAVPEALQLYVEGIEGLSDQRIVLFSTSGGGKDLPPEQWLELQKLKELLSLEPYSMVKFLASQDNGDEAYALGVAAAGQ